MKYVVYIMYTISLEDLDTGNILVEAKGETLSLNVILPLLTPLALQIIYILLKCLPAKESQPIFLVHSLGLC